MASPVSLTLETAAGKVRSFLARAGFFWKGGAVLAGTVFAALLIVAYTVPEVYESNAVIAYEKVPGAALQDDGALEERLHTALLDPRTLERVARGLTPEIGNASTPVPTQLVERIRQSIGVHRRGPQTFTISFRAGSAAYAQHGAQELTQLAIQYLDTEAAASSPAAEEAAKRAKALEDRTRELAAFVAAHPEVAMSKVDEPSPARESSPPPAASSSKSSSSAADTAILVLQQEKAKLEARLAEAEKQKAATAGGEGNPYDPLPDDDPESLRQMIAQVKIAITARQNAVSRPHRDDSSASSSEKKNTAAAVASSALRAEWQRLVQALLEAQHDQPVKRDIPSMLRILEPAPLPSSPVKPNRPVLALVGLASGLWIGVLWAFARVALGHDAPRVPLTPAVPSPQPAVAEPIALPATFTAEPVRPIALLPAPSSAAPPSQADPVAPVVRHTDEKTVVDTVGEESPSPRPTTPSTAPPKPSLSRPPLRLRVTQRGVIDLAAVLAHTGTAAASTMPRGVNASPIVGVGDGTDEAHDAAGPPIELPPSPAPPSPAPPTVREPTRSRPPPPIVESSPPVSSAMTGTISREDAPRRPAPLPNARTLVGHLAPEPAPSTQRFASNQPPPQVSAPPPRPRSDPPPRPRSDPPLIPRTDPPLIPRSDPPAQARSDPPARPRSDPPARPRSDPPARPRSDPPARPRSDPPARPRSDPPTGPRSDPPEQRPRADAPDGIISLRDVPPGWSPEPSIVGGNADELRAIREQLYRFAVRGCYVVGVTGSPDAIEGKSLIAARLATVLAEPGRARVLLMEADFDGPSVHRLMRIEMPLTFGFSEQVRRRMKQAPAAPWSIVRCSANLQVLAEGRVRAPGLLSSVQFMDGLSELRRYYDVIVLDGPAAGSVDARVLDEISDGLVVVGPNEAAMPEIRKNASQWFSKKGWMATLPAQVSRDSS
jgi:Mrp family chromosome partitioning ATPase